ncbi:PREDICTED: bidirectional sugar transporter SWEET16-like isoform X1 [Nelumbo nucifera]|uniref:Bidirectional sugar transporter SWEET16-like isoform X1 n=1 Tax=Nelumbo nucifera TaxID=4432 RepID=A0A1U8A035_NELNU|nr:PREDICTED: bidirectional sugar transporter SWEET16-like isoform X1 [Nelumbo nucifera]
MIDSGFGKGKKGKKIIQHYKRVYLVAKRATPHLKGVSDQQSHSILLLLASSIHMASLSFIVGIIGNIISILVFTSPIGTFRRVVKKKSTESFKGLPYICTLLSTSLWSFYGLLKPGGLLIVTVNGTGAVLQFIYVTLFLIYAPKDTKVKLMKLVALLNVGCLGLVIAVTLLAIHGSLRLTVVGFLCAGLTLGMYASPLVAMRMVIRTKSVDYMPFSLSFFLFLNGGVWSVYAVLVKDLFIGVPNAIGFVLGSAQLILYAVYRRKSASQKSTEAKEEEGSAHLVRGNVEMSEYEDSSEFKTKNRSLNKGMSLPKSSVARQHSFTKILKTLSLSPYKLHHSSLADDDEDDVEKGTTHSHH